MQHRQPRLGDTLDDYCPRERRITNHAVVAMVGPEIKQTRCTTCDAEHEYKNAKMPALRKKKESSAALYKQVLDAAQPEATRAAQPSAVEEHPTPPPPAEPVEAPPEQAAAPPVSAPDQEVAGDQPQAPGTDDEGPVHRRLIRATLPRPEGPVQRPLPQFTVRQPGKFNNPARGGGRPQMTRPRTSNSRGPFGRNGSRGDMFTARPSGGGTHHSMQRSRPAHRAGGRPARHGKKSPK